MKINDVLLARILQKNHKVQLHIDLTSSFSRYFTINGNSNFFKCRDCDEFQYGIFENATRICKNQGGFDDLFPTFPDFNFEIRYSATWGPFDWDLNDKLNKLFVDRKKSLTGYYKDYTSKNKDIMEARARSIVRRIFYRISKNDHMKPNISF